MQTTNVSPAAIATLAKSSNDAQAIAVTKAVAIVEKINIELNVDEDFFLAMVSTSFD
jgi:hypothetical protein